MCLTPKDYNDKTSLGIFVPVTSKVKGYPFEVPVDGQHVRGVILADQIRSLDWRTRNTRFIEQAPTELVDEVIKKLSLLIGFPS